MTTAKPEQISIQNSEGLGSERSIIDSNYYNSKYANGGAMILEYKDGIIAYDCKKMEIRGANDDRYLQYTPICSIIVKFRKKKRLDVTFIPDMNNDVQIDPFKSFAYVTFFSNHIISPNIGKMDFEDLANHLLKIHGYYD